jgi:hypothetical protein
MRRGEINAMLNNLNNIKIALAEAAGAAVEVEVKMRLIGEKSIGIVTYLFSIKQ